MMEKNDIFEEIIKKLDYCQYISDLRSMIEFQHVQEITQVIEEMSVDEYSVKEWTELYNYLLRSKKRFETAKEAYEGLLEYLKK